MSINMLKTKKGNEVWEKIALPKPHHEVEGHELPESEGPLLWIVGVGHVAVLPARVKRIHQGAWLKSTIVGDATRNPQPPPKISTWVHQDEVQGVESRVELVDVQELPRRLPSHNDVPWLSCHVHAVLSRDEHGDLHSGRLVVGPGLVTTLGLDDEGHLRRIQAGCLAEFPHKGIVLPQHFPEGLQHIVLQVLGKG